MSTGERIRQARIKKGLTLLEIAKLLGKTEATVQRYESGNIKNLKSDTILELARVLDASPTFLMGWEDKMNRPHLSATSDVVLVSLPVYRNVSYGTGTLDYGVTIEHVNVPSEWITDKNYFALIAKGDSMTSARINEGDVLIIQEQNDAENGEIAAVLVDEEIMLKRIYKTDNSFMLISENPKYAPRVFNPSTDYHIRILGKLKKAITNF